MSGLRSHYEYLEEITVKNKIDIICIQETNLKNAETIRTKNFKCYNKNRIDCTSASGGVAILVNDDLQYMYYTKY